MAGTTALRNPRLAIKSSKRRKCPIVSSWLSPENSTINSASGVPLTKSDTESRNAGLSLARSISVRSTISTAVGCNSTMCCVASAAS